MIKIENTEVVGWEHAIRGMRNPLNSWDKSDSCSCSTRYCIECNLLYTPQCEKVDIILGENDLSLMKKLSKAGTDHRKFMRMIVVYCDVTAPLYWIAEHDTYKVGTVRNSCSFMHKGTSKLFEITDFSVDDERMYEILSPLSAIEYELTYPYETDEYRIYTTENDRDYKVYRNGRVFRCAYSYVDNYGTGRTRTFEEKEIVPSKTRGGYFEINIGGRNGEKWLIHRLVASVWKNNPDDLRTVNHINGNKGDNSVENLEWLSLEDNIKHGFDNGFYDKNKLHASYIQWKNGHIHIDPIKKAQMRIDKNNGLSRRELSNKYNLPVHVIDNLTNTKPCENNDLFHYCYIWEKIINTLNSLRQEYLDTKDDNVFFAIRQLLPQGYNVRYTWQANYEVLANIYHSRKDHKLTEWHTFCDWIESLPYSELITGKESN